MAKYLFTLLALLFLVVMATPALAAWNPEGWEAKGEAAPHYAISPAEAVAEGFLTLYKEVFSPIDGDRCPSYPSCSTYATIAIRKYGVLKGTILTSGRLLSEADEAAFAPRIQLETMKVYSPPERDMKLLWGER